MTDIPRGSSVGAPLGHRFYRTKVQTTKNMLNNVGMYAEHRSPALLNAHIHE